MVEYNSSATEPPPARCHNLETRTFPARERTSTRLHLTLLKNFGRRISLILPTAISPRRYARNLPVVPCLSSCCPACRCWVSSPWRAAEAEAEALTCHTRLREARPVRSTAPSPIRTMRPSWGHRFASATQTSSSTQYGSYIIPNIAVPSGQTSLVGNVIATANGQGSRLQRPESGRSPLYRRHHPRRADRHVADGHTGLHHRSRA